MQNFFTTKIKTNNIITAPHSSAKRYDSQYQGSADRGTDTIAKHISEKLNFTLILPTYSRFIIDFNKEKQASILTKFKTHILPKITQEEKEKRLEQHKKYYYNLTKLTTTNTLLISIHSMTPIGGKNTSDENIKGPDIRLGTLNQKSIKKETLNTLKNELKKQNLTIEIDNYFKGGEEIKQTLKNNAQSIQIEINTNHILTNNKTDKIKIKKISKKLEKAISKIISKTDKEKKKKD